MAAAGFAITISAVDAATGVIERINKRILELNARITAAGAPMRRFGESLQTFTKVTGLDKIATGFADIARAGTQAFRSLMRVVEPLAAITGAVTLAGMVKLVETWGEFGVVLGNAAIRAGTSADSLYTLQHAAMLAGVSAGELTAGVTTLNDNMRNVQFGGGAGFLTVLRAIGVSYADLAKQSPEQRLKTLATALQGVKNITDRALYTKELFGGEGMLPFLNQSADGIQRFIDEAKEFGGVMTPEQIQHAREFNRAWIDLGISVTGFRNSIADVLGPALRPLLLDISGLVVQMRTWIDTNQDWLRSEISEKVGEFVTWLNQVDWNAVGQGILQFGTEVEHVATALGGWIPAGKKVLEFFAAVWLGGMLAPLVQIATLLLALPAKAAVAASAAEIAMAPVLASLALLGVAGAATAATYFNGQNAASSQDIATRMGYTQVAGADEMGMPISFKNPMTGDTRSAMSFDPRFNANVRAPTGTVAENARVMDKILQGEGGFTPEASAALLGGAIQESGIGTDPRAGEGAIFQWDEARRRRIHGQFGKWPKDMTPEEQARAAAWEINSQPEFGPLSRRMHASHNLPEMNYDVTKTFEAPADVDNNEVPHRLELSAGVLSALAAGGAAGDPVPLPSAQAGAPGATGKVDMNVRVIGAPAAVTAQTSGGIGLNIANPGLIGQ